MSHLLDIALGVIISFSGLYETHRPFGDGNHGILCIIVLSRVCPGNFHISIIRLLTMGNIACLRLGC